MDNDSLGLVGFMMGMGMMMVWCVLLLIVIAAMWVVFQKAGRPGWHSIIPFLNIYDLVQIAGRPGWWMLLLLVPFLNIIVAIIVSIDLARRFGKGTGFGILLALLPFIGYSILAFSDARYDGGLAPAPIG
ncbi:MAG TPA: DUF5684 domain-containing protein [Candidatus Eisenbacteria bacterium]